MEKWGGGDVTFVELQSSPREITASEALTQAVAVSCLTRDVSRACSGEEREQRAQLATQSLKGSFQVFPSYGSRVSSSVTGKCVCREDSLCLRWTQGTEGKPRRGSTPVKMVL